MNLQQKDDKYTGSESVVLSLEKLNIQYKNMLIEYRQAVTNYVDFLNQEINSDDNHEMTTIPNATYWGTSAISQNNSSTLQECSASCASVSGCTGATFNPTSNEQPMCWLRGGDSNITNGQNSDYAIIPKGKQLLLTVQTLNQKLTYINEHIQKLTQNGQESYNSESQERKENTLNLVRQSIQLNNEREKIHNAINDYQTIDEQKSQGDLVVNKNYYSFLLLVLLAAFTIFILYKFGFNSISQQQSSTSLQGGGG
jgi:hypothetical protein